MTMHKMLHPRYDVERLYCLENKEEEDLPASIHRYNDMKTA